MGLSGSYFYPGIDKWHTDLPPKDSFQNSSSFVGDDWSVLLGPFDVSPWTNLSVTLVNNSVNNLESGSVEFSPDASNWETDYDVSTFAALTSSGTTSLQISNNSRKWIRVRGIPSGSGGALTGSIDAYLHVNSES